MPTQRELRTQGRTRAFQMLYMYQQGKSWNDMCLYFGITQQGIVSHLQRHCQREFDAARSHRKKSNHASSTRL